MKKTNMIRSAAVFTLLAGGACLAMADENHHAVTTTTVTGAAGAITQANYNESGGSVNGLLVGTNTLLEFPGTVCGGVGSLGVAGNKVTYSGTQVTYTSGWQMVAVTSFTNNTTNATYTKPTVTKPAAYGPVSGLIKQLNHAENGAVNGFVFTPATGAAVFVDLQGPPSAALAPLLTVGASVSVTGTSEAAPLCAPAGTPVEVDASSLTIGTTTVTIGHGGR